MAYKFMADGIFHKYMVQSLALYLSIVDLGGEAKKSQVLGNIKNKEYLLLKKHNLLYTKHATEPRWKNQIAFLVHHLKELKYMDKDAPHGIWRFYGAGRENITGGILHCLEELKADKRTRGLSGNWYRKALSYIFFVFETEKIPLPAFITPDLIEKIEKMTDSEEWMI